MSETAQVTCIACCLLVLISIGVKYQLVYFYDCLLLVFCIYNAVGIIVFWRLLNIFTEKLKTFFSDKLKVYGGENISNDTTNLQETWIEQNQNANETSKSNCHPNQNVKTEFPVKNTLSTQFNYSGEGRTTCDDLSRPNEERNELNHVRNSDRRLHLIAKKETSIKYESAFIKDSKMRIKSSKESHQIFNNAPTLRISTYSYTDDALHRVSCSKRNDNPPTISEGTCYIAKSRQPQKMTGMLIHLSLRRTSTNIGVQSGNFSERKQQNKLVRAFPIVETNKTESDPRSTFNNMSKKSDKLTYKNYDNPKHYSSTKRKSVMTKVLSLLTFGLFGKRKRNNSISLFILVKLKFKNDKSKTETVNFSVYIYAYCLLNFVILEI